MPFFQSSVEEMENRESEVYDVVDAGKKVLEQPRGDTSGVKKKVEGTSNKWKEVKSKLVEKRDKEESNFKQLVKYASITNELEKWVHSTTSNVMASGAKPSKEPEDTSVVNKQLDHIKVFLSVVVSMMLREFFLVRFLCFGRSIQDT